MSLLSICHSWPCFSLQYDYSSRGITMSLRHKLTGAQIFCCHPKGYETSPVSITAEWGTFLQLVEKLDEHLTALKATHLKLPTTNLAHYPIGFIKIPLEHTKSLYIFSGKGLTPTATLETSITNLPTNTTVSIPTTRHFPNLSFFHTLELICHHLSYDSTLYSEYKYLFFKLYIERIGGKFPTSSTSHGTHYFQNLLHHYTTKTSYPESGELGGNFNKILKEIQAYDIKHATSFAYQGLLIK